MKEIVFVCGHTFRARDNNKFGGNGAKHQPIQQKPVDDVKYIYCSKGVQK